MKQFKNYEEFKKWYDGFVQSEESSLDAMLHFVSEDDIAEALVAEGYDIDDLIEDGHGYEIAGHTNNGWLYADEADADYMNRVGSKVELRAR